MRRFKDVWFKVGLLVALSGISAALATYTIPQPGTALTGFDFTCMSTLRCPAWVPIDSTGVEKFTTGNPGSVVGTAAETHLGEVGGNQIRVDVPLTTTAVTYSSGNAIGGLQTIAGAARVSGTLGTSGTGGLLQQVNMNSKVVLTSQMEVWVFSTNPTGSTCTNASGFVLATADFDKVVGVALIPATLANNSGWFSGGTGSLGQAANLALPYDLSSATSLFACTVTRGTPALSTTSDISMKYQFLRN